MDQTRFNITQTTTHVLTLTRACWCSNDKGEISYLINLEEHHHFIICVTVTELGKWVKLAPQIVRFYAESLEEPQQRRTLIIAQTPDCFNEAGATERLKKENKQLCSAKEARKSPKMEKIKTGSNGQLNSWYGLLCLILILILQERLHV